MTFKELYFSFNGRISRSTYWLRGVIPIYGSLVAIILFGQSIQDNPSSGPMLAVLMVIWLVFTLIAGVAMEVKRWHDRGKSGAWVFIRFIPLIGPLWTFVEVGCLPGDSGENAYGPDPLDGDFMDVE